MKQNKYYRVKRVVDNEYYILESCDGDIVIQQIKDIDKLASVFTIADAKDGDVLVTEDYIFIFKYILHGGVHLYCHYDIDDEEFDADIPDAIIGNIHDKGAHFQPATKEQSAFLFRKMKEVGYKWDEEKKELRNIRPHYDIDNFKPKQWVLVRDDEGYHCNNCGRFVWVSYNVDKPRKEE